MFIVSTVWSNDDEWTGSTPTLFEHESEAIAHFTDALEEALDDFISNGYCSAADAVSIRRVYRDGVDVEEGKTSWTLRYSFIDGFFDFWNDSWFDFWYSIEIHEMQEKTL